MNKKLSLVLISSALVIVLGGGAAAYSYLSKTTTPESPTLDTTQGTTTEETVSEDQPAEEEFQLAPDFTVTNMDGEQVLLSSYFGKPLVVNFWASWCPPCKEEMPHFQEVYDDMGDDVTFLMVDMVDGQRETMSNGKDYIEEMGYSFPVHFDSDQEAANTYGVYSLPTTIFIDENGYLITGAKGSISKETLLKGISYITEVKD